MTQVLTPSSVSKPRVKAKLQDYYNMEGADDRRSGEPGGRVVGDIIAGRPTAIRAGRKVWRRRS